MRRPVLIGGPGSSTGASWFPGPRWVLLLSVLSLFPGCREITAPPVVPVVPGDSGPLVVLGIEGQVQVGAWVHLSDLAYAEDDQYHEWAGTADSAGFIFPELTVGRYDARIEPRAEAEPDWRQLAIELREEVQALDPRPHMKFGNVAVPAGFPTSRMEIEFKPGFPSEKSTFGGGLRSRIGPSGDFTMIWPAEGVYVVRLLGPGMRLNLDDSYLLPRPEVLQFGFEAIWMDAVLTLGGGRLPVGEIQIRAETDLGEIESPIEIDGSTASFWALTGPGSLTILPGSGMPFLRCTVFHEFREGNVPAVELGDYLIEFVFIASSGEEVVGASVSLFDAETGDERRLSGAGSRLSLFLRGGQYALVVRHPVFSLTELTFDVSQDEILTVVMNREPGS